MARHPLRGAARGILRGAPILLLAASCAPVPPSPSPTALPSPSATATIAFPTLIPTLTWTPAPLPSATAGTSLGLGEVILQDSFDDPSAWSLTTTATGAASLDQGRLTLAIRAARAYHFAHRLPPDAADFYAAVDIYSLVCSSQDEFGLIARMNSLGEQYRFVIGCDGTARISRALLDGTRGLTLRVPSNAIITGAPAHNHLEIWADGLDLKLAVNGTEVAAARDAALSRGTFGLLARAGPEGQVTVSFDNLIVRGLLDVRSSPAASATAPP